MKYKNYTDEELVELTKQGDIKAEKLIFRKYNKIIKERAKFYFLFGAERDDIIQEAMIAIFFAIQSYNKNKKMTFESYANLCIRRRIYNMIKQFARKKHKILNTSVSLNDDNRNKVFLLPSKDLNPEQLIIGKELIKELKSVINSNLSNLEQKVLYYYLVGKSYQEISEKLGIDIKAVDNALSRLKKRLSKIVAEEEYEYDDINIIEKALSRNNLL